MRDSSPNASAGSPDRTAAARAAAEWVARLDRGLTEAERLALEKWKAANPVHADELGRLRSGWQALDRAGAVPALVAMAEAAESGARSRRVRRRMWSQAGGLAAAAAAIAVGLALWQRPAAMPPESLAEPTPAGGYSVEASSVHALGLEDASIAQLRGDSVVRPEFRPSERRVKLERGEAHFIVAKNPSRPFVVTAGPISVEALGTAFDVRLGDESIQVLVTEGSVALASAERLPMGGVLSAGERAVVHLQDGVGTSVTVDRPSPSENDRELAWEATHLVFNRTPLAQVVDAFNGYNSRKMVLSEPGLGARTLTGTFRADNLTGFVRLLSASVDVVAETDEHGRLVLKPAPGTHP